MRALTQLQKACCCEQHRGGMMGDWSREGSLYKVGFIEAKTYNRKAVRATQKNNNHTNYTVFDYEAGCWIN